MARHGFTVVGSRADEGMYGAGRIGESLNRLTTFSARRCDG